nr:hypothetical protein [Candidatus Sigynarchaeota archaeon]
MVDMVIGDVPVKVQLEKSIITEEYTGATPLSLRKGPVKMIVLILPAAITGVLILLGVLLGIYTEYTGPAENYGGKTPAQWRSEAQMALLFWTLFFMVSWYGLLLIRRQMFKSVQEAHRVTQISSADHKKLLTVLFGPVSIIVSLIIFVIIAVYDFNAFGLEIDNIYATVLPAPEGWLLDSGFGVELYGPYYVNEAMAVVWLIIWWCGDLMSAMYCWAGIGFLIYSRAITKKFSFRNEPAVVSQLRLTSEEEKAFVAVSYGFVPFLTLKSLAQIILTPWWSDTIITIVTLAFFILLLFIPIKNVTADIKSETKGNEFDAKAKSILALIEILEKVDKGEELSLKKAVMALLYASYLEQIKSIKNQGKSNNTKVLTSLAGPVASYGAKTGLKF